MIKRRPLIFVISYLLSTQAPIGLACTEDNQPLNQALQNRDLDTLAALLPPFKRQSHCTLEEIDHLQRQMSQLAVAKAKQLLQAGALEPAKQLLLQPRYAPFNSWEVQAVLGEIAWRHQEWSTASGLFNQALDLLDDPKETPIPPTSAEKQKVYQLAVETQLLTGTLSTVRGGGEPGGIFRSALAVETTPVPVQFVFGKATFTQEGQHSANKLVGYFKRQNPHRITLVGHTDPVGADNYNCELSEQRAETLKKYLITEGISAAKITTLGKGKREALSLYDPSNYTQEHINQLNRRVEFALDKSVADSNACR